MKKSALTKRFKYHFKDMFIKSPILSLLFLTCSLFIPDSAFCQPLFNSTEEQKNQFTNMLSVPPDGKFMERSTKNHGDNTLSEKEYPQKIIMHIRGKSKFKFPPKEKFYQHYKELLKKAQSMMADKKISERDNQVKKEDVLLSVTSMVNKSLSLCEKGTTEKRDGIIPNDDQKNVLHYDFLVLKPGTKYPENIEEAFGKGAVVRYYSNVGFFSERLTQLNIHCLPFRIRSMGNTLIKDEGRNALLNYDKDFYGRGELKRSVSEIMHIR